MVLYLVYRQSGIKLFISLLSRKQSNTFPKMSNYSFKTLPRLNSRNGKWKRQWCEWSWLMMRIFVWFLRPPVSLTVQKSSPFKCFILSLARLQWLYTGTTFAQCKNLRGMWLWSKCGKILWLRRKRKRANKKSMFFFHPLFSKKKDKSQEFLSVWNKK